MTETIDELRRKLEAGLAGVTPGPWVYEEDRHTHDSAVHQDIQLPRYRDGSEMAYYGPDKGGVVGSSEWIWLKAADGRHIANCSPDNIRALLDALTALEAEIARLREGLPENFNPDGGISFSPIRTLEARAEAAEAERDKAIIRANVQEDRAERAECREWARTAEAEGLTRNLEQLASEVEELRTENFALSANQCEGGYGDEYGNHRCTVVDAANAQVAAIMAERDQLAARVTALEGALTECRSALMAIEAREGRYATVKESAEIARDALAALRTKEGL